MAENSAIEWTDHTFNPWEGCQKVGPGCDHCYAETRNARYAPKGVVGAPNWGPGAPRRRTSIANWNKPLRWQADAAAFLAAHGRRQRVFCASLADVFDNAVASAWRADLARLIIACPDLEWLLLTKRIGNVLDMLIAMFPAGVPANVRIGATIVNQEEANRDLSKVEQVAVACIAKPFLSMEPLLGGVDLFRAHPRWMRMLGWIIVGGESGPGARPGHVDWYRSLRDQCAEADVPFLFKQWGEWTAAADGDRCIMLDGQDLRNLEPHGTNGDGSVRISHVGKKKAGRILDGRTHDGLPA